MFKWLENKFENIFNTKLDWVQIEITTSCNASCVYCPHTILKSCWQNKHMSLEVFKKIIPLIKNSKLIYLQGWDEPLLNKSIFDMIRICKENGRKVGFTTNGMLLDKETIIK